MSRVWAHCLVLTAAAGIGRKQGRLSMLRWRSVHLLQEGGALFTGGCTVHGRGGTRQMMILSDCFRWAEEGGNGKEMGGDRRKGREGDGEVHG